MQIIKLTLVSKQFLFFMWYLITCIDSSNGFSVEYFDTYKVVYNLIKNEKYALVCCNNSLANFTIGYHAAVNTPLNNVGVDNELDSLPFFEVTFFLVHTRGFFLITCYSY